MSGIIAGSRLDQEVTQVINDILRGKRGKRRMHSANQQA